LVEFFGFIAGTLGELQQIGLVLGAELAFLDVEYLAVLAFLGHHVA